MTPSETPMNQADIDKMVEAQDALWTLALNRNHVVDENSFNYALTGDQIRALLSRLRALEEAQAWQPMETAPRDGTSFLIAFDVCGTGEMRVTDTHWCGPKGTETGWEAVEPDDILYGWMLKPEPPTIPLVRSPKAGDAA